MASPSSRTARIFGSATTPDVEISAIQGTIWALVRNAIEGVTIGFTKVLEIEGVGYRAAIEGKELVLVPWLCIAGAGADQREGRDHC